MFDRAEEALEACGATYHDVVRTWIYLSDILDWYEEFNVARNEKYDELGIMPDVSTGASGRDQGKPLCLPASTGIAAENPDGAACAMDVLAIIAPDSRQVEVEQMTNVKQKDAFVYGSAFSRGACIREPDVTSISISGTASIDQQGLTTHTGNVRGQIVSTLDNIESLIAEKGATLQDICQASVFIKHPEHLAVYREVAADRGLADMPAICMNTDICRDDLLFEIDGVAVVAK